MKWRWTGTDNMYEVTVQATDADRRMGTKPVTVRSPTWTSRGW